MGQLISRRGPKIFCDKIKEEFTTCVPVIPSNRKSNHFPLFKPVEFSNIFPLQSPVNQVNNRKNLQKAHNKSGNSKPANKPSPTTCTYTQALSANI